jgi:hypothetical protein
MPIPVPSLPARAAGRSPSIGTFTVPATPGREAVPPVPTPIRMGRTRAVKCCVSSSSIRSRVRPNNSKLLAFLAAGSSSDDGASGTEAAGFKQLESRHRVGLPPSLPDDVLPHEEDFESEQDHEEHTITPRSKLARYPRSGRTGARCRSTTGSSSRESLFCGGCRPERRSVSCLLAGWQATRCRPGSPRA